MVVQHVKAANGEHVPVTISTVAIGDGGAARPRIVHLLYRRGDDTLREPLIGNSGLPDRVLTEREHRVLELLAEGHGTKELANHLSISPATARTHVRNILAKLEAHSRLEAVFKALRSHLI